MLRLLGVLLIAAVVLPGCSVYMAADGADRKDLSVLSPGSSRDRVLSELGHPLVSKRGNLGSVPPAGQTAAVETTPAPAGETAAPAGEQAGTLNPVSRYTDEPERYDIFEFTQERSTGSNAARAVIYSTMAVLTLGLSEIVTTPLEAVAGDAGKRRIRVTYDENDKILDSRLQDPDT